MLMALSLGMTLSAWQPVLTCQFDFEFDAS